MSSRTEVLAGLLLFDLFIGSGHAIQIAFVALTQGEQSGRHGTALGRGGGLIGDDAIVLGLYRIGPEGSFRAVRSLARRSRAAR